MINWIIVYISYMYNSKTNCFIPARLPTMSPDWDVVHTHVHVHDFQNPMTMWNACYQHME